MISLINLMLGRWAPQPLAVVHSHGSGEGHVKPEGQPMQLSRLHQAELQGYLDAVQVTLSGTLKVYSVPQ